MRLSYLVRGFPGHPLHPPLTDATIGAYTTATVLGILAFAGVSEGNLTKAWWLALLVGLGFTALAALTGLADWLSISWRSPLWWTATYHMISMLTATAFFALAPFTCAGAKLLEVLFVHPAIPPIAAIAEPKPASFTKFFLFIIFNFDLF